MLAEAREVRFVDFGGGPLERKAPPLESFLFDLLLAPAGGRFLFFVLLFCVLIFSAGR